MNSLPIKVLIVDDTKTTRFILKKLLIENGYQTFEAEDGITALQQIKTIQPDIVLMDFQMPDMNGIECCRCIKENSEMNHIRVIMVTSESAYERMSEAYKAGCNDYITKPVKEDELLEKLKDVERYIHISRTIHSTKDNTTPFKTVLK